MMKDFLTEDTKAIILLCGVFGKDHAEKPLSLSEYSSLVRWLVGVKMRPGDLLQKENVVDASIGSGLDLQRLGALLGRGAKYCGLMPIHLIFNFFELLLQLNA